MRAITATRATVTLRNDNHSALQCCHSSRLSSFAITQSTRSNPVSAAASSGDEHELRNSVRGILPMLSGVAIPKPRGLTLEELVARGGKPMTADDHKEEEEMDGQDDWL